MHYDIFRSITRLQTVLLHTIHCKHEIEENHVQSRFTSMCIYIYVHKCKGLTSLRKPCSYNASTEALASGPLKDNRYLVKSRIAKLWRGGWQYFRDSSNDEASAFMASDEISVD